MIHRDRLITWLNSIQWHQSDGISSEVQQLIDEHLGKIRGAIEYIRATQNINTSEAHGIAQTAGYSSPEYEEVLDELFNHVEFGGAGVREPIILAVSACYCWELDPELKKLSNPWLPLLELIGMGYTVSNEDSPDGENISLLIGHQNGIEMFLIA